MIKMSEEKEICFVIMPFSKTTTKHTQAYWTKHFKDFLKPLIEEYPSLEARRSKPRRGGVLSEIITALVTSPVVVADITDQNPTVFWELGVRQSFKHGTVTIAEEGTKPPFDVSAKGTLFYSNERLKNEAFRKDFKEAVLDCLEHPERSDSQVFEILSGRGTLFEIFRRDEAIRRLNAVLADIKWNNELHNTIIEAVQENIEKRKGKKGVSIPVGRLVKSSADSLLVNRYVDEDEAFFEIARDYSNNIIASNHILESWKYDDKNSESWLLESVEELGEVSDEFKKRVEAALDKLSKRF
jgi:hypothetical protein